MALAKMDFHSNSLSRIVCFNILLPDGLSNEQKSRMKTLYLLHGYCGNHNDWLVYSRISELSTKYNLAVVMPSGENSFYVDGIGEGRYFGQYIGKELVEYTRMVFGLSMKQKDTFIGGLSMGGFGAL